MAERHSNSPGRLWVQADEDPERYRALLREHKLILSPGDEGYEQGSRTLPCGYPGPSKPAAEWCIHELAPGTAVAAEDRQPSAAAHAPAVPGSGTPGVGADVVAAPSPGSSPSLMAAVAGRMSEDELDRLVRGVLKDLERLGRKVLAYHPWNSRHSAGGWPDWAFVGAGGFMLRELKRESREPRADQQEWLGALIAAEIDAGCWRPSDWYSGRITRELAAIAGIGGAT